MLDIRTNKKQISYEVLLPNKLFIRSVLKSNVVHISHNLLSCLWPLIITSANSRDCCKGYLQSEKNILSKKLHHKFHVN